MTTRWTRSRASSLVSRWRTCVLAVPGPARAVEGFTYLPDHLLLINAATVLATTSAPAGPHAAPTLRPPSLRPPAGRPPCRPGPGCGPGPAGRRAGPGRAPGPATGTPAA